MSQHSIRRGSAGRRSRSWSSRSRSWTSSAAALLLGERVPRVVVGHREQIDAVPALRDEQRHLVARPLGQPLGDAVHALGLARQDDLVRDERQRQPSRRLRRFASRPAPRASAPVVLREERGDDLLVGDLGLLDRERRHVGELAGAHVEERDLHEVPLAVEAEHVAVDVVDRDDALLLAHLLDGAELVAVDGRQLEPHLARAACFMLLVELARQLVVTPLEELRHRVDLLGVPPAVDRETHGAGHRLIWYCRHGPLAARELDVAAGAELEVLVDEVQRAPSPPSPKWYGPK